jgi:hypothetical protein
MYFLSGAPMYDVSGVDSRDQGLRFTMKRPHEAALIDVNEVRVVRGSSPSPPRPLKCAAKAILGADIAMIVKTGNSGVPSLPSQPLRFGRSDAERYFFGQIWAVNYFFEFNEPMAVLRH